MSRVAQKYSLISLASFAAQAFGSMREAKAAFQDAASNSRDVVLLDYNGETYARCVSGKVLPGQHYRKFTQRGTKVKTSPAVPVLPDYVKRQDAWLAEHNLKVGDKVVVKTTAERDEQGWNNWWAPIMTEMVDKELTIVGIEGSSGITLNDKYRDAYPFFVLEPAPAPVACPVVGVKEICQDVINRIDGQMLIAFGNRLVSDETKRTLTKAGGSESLQKILVKDDPRCAACGKGSVLLSFVRLKNNFTVGQLERLTATSASGWKIDSRWPSELVEMFGKKLLDEIEVAFELNDDFDWTDESISKGRKTDLINKYSRLEKTPRLRQIMQDIVDGTF